MEPEDTLGQLAILNSWRCEAFGHKLHDWSPTDWSNAVAGETGELCNKTKKLLRGDNIPMEDVRDEVADIVIYLDLFCQRMGFDLATCIKSKFNKTSDKIGSTLKF